MYSNFLLGTLQITDAARASLKRIPYDLIARHAINEHGAITKREARKNEVAMRTIGEIVSRYPIDPRNTNDGCVLVVTQATWDETTVKLESE